MENTVDYEKEIFLNSISDIKKKSDGSFWVYYNGLPYHISNSDEMVEKYNWLSEYTETNPEKINEYIEKVYIPTVEEQAEYHRSKRDNLLNEADNLLMKYQEQVTLGIVQENKNYYTALLQYKQNLRDITKQNEFPENVVWPELPIKEE